MHLDAKAGPAAHIATQERREQIIIAVILNHPCLYDKIGERLGTVDFTVPKLDKLRQEVLKALAGNSALDAFSVDEAGPAAADRSSKEHRGQARNKRTDP